MNPCSPDLDAAVKAAAEAARLSPCTYRVLFTFRRDELADALIFDVPTQRMKVARLGDDLREVRMVSLIPQGRRPTFVYLVHTPGGWRQATPDEAEAARIAGMERATRQAIYS
jgi:hypothetical protein